MRPLYLQNAEFARLAMPLVQLRLLSLADVHVADRLAGLANESDPAVLLAAACTVGAQAGGHTGVALSALPGSLQAKVAAAAEVDPQASADALAALAALGGEWAGKVRTSGLVATGTDQLRPLVCAGDLLQTHRMADYEARLAGALRGRARLLPLTSTQHQALGEALVRLGGSFVREPEQERAAAVAAMCALSVISGGPGTGKTTTVRKVILALRAALGEPDLRVALAAPTGKAAARMREALLAGPPAGQSDGIADEERQWLGKLQTSTLHRMLGYQPRTPSRFRHNPANPLAFQLIVVDEASMIDVAMMCKLVEATPPDARLVLLGDRNQLASVDAGSVLADVTQLPVDRTGMGAELRARVEAVLGSAFAPQQAARHDPLAECMIRFRKAFRFETKQLGEAIYGVAAASELPERSEAERDQVAAVIKHLQTADSTVLKLVTPSAGAKVWEAGLVEEAVEAYQQALAPLFAKSGRVDAEIEAKALREIDNVRVLAAHREGPLGVSGLNAQLVDALRNKLGLTPGERRQRWWPGRLVLVTQNDYENQLWNGDIGIVLRGGEHADVLFAGPNGPRKVPAAALPAHETAFAMTIHKSQGSQFEHVYVVLPKEQSRILTRELLYTAMSRARKRLTLYAATETLQTALMLRVQRATALGARLWTT